MVEEWRDVVGFEGLYQVSNLGRVKSFVKYKDGRLLKPGKASHQYYTVSLKRNNSRTVHSLVAEAFLGPKPNNMEVLHIDGTRHNNTAYNLRYGTRSENLFDAVRHGAKGKLTAQQIADIREQLKTETRGLQSALARQYGVAICTINSIKFNRIYTQV